jgi:hypothetical protein
MSQLKSRFSEDPLTFITGLFSLIIGFLFLYEQLGKILSPEHALQDIALSPIGYSEWGFIWSDLIICVPLFIIGGLLLLLGRYSLGRIFTFSAWALSVYATMFFIISYQSLGKPLLGYEIVGGIIGILIGLIFMAYLAWGAIKTDNKLEF